MQRDKADIKQRNSKSNNDSILSKSKPSTSSKNKRDASTDRNNMKKPVPTTNLSSRSTSNTTVKSSLNAPKIISKNTPSTSRSSALKPKTNTTKLPEKKTSTNSTKQVPLKAFKNSTGATPKGTTDSSTRSTKYLPKSYQSSVTRSSRIPQEPTSSRKQSVDKIGSYIPFHDVKNITKPESSRKKLDKTGIKNTQDSEKSETRRERTLTRTLSPSEVKFIKNISDDSVENGDVSERNFRPRTATIRKHSGEEESKSVEEPKNNETKNEINPQSDENDYEDDFDSYESDFEAYSSSSNVSELSSSDSSSESSTDSSNTSTPETPKPKTSVDDERKLDSGAYDLSELKQKKLLDGIKEAMERENEDIHKLKKPEINSNPSSLTDEGFEDGIKHSFSNNGFINFSNLLSPEKPKSKYTKRGEDLMNMIRLNSVYYHLFSKESISYETFMKSYGKTGTVQVSSQTGDDDVDEEIQTDQIQVLTKWTQHPVRFSKNPPEKENVTKWDECLGVGNDPPLPSNQTNNNTNIYSTSKLWKFLQKSSKIVLSVLENKKLVESKKYDSEEIYSDGYFKINTSEISFLKHRFVNQITFSKNYTILSVHKSNDTGDQGLKSLICVWNLNKIDYPKHVLICSGDVVKICFDHLEGNLIFAAMKDGSLNVWDVWDSSKSFNRIITDEISKKTFEVYPPLSTALPNINLVPSTSKIIALETFQTNYTSDDVSHSEISNLQLCTLDEEGILIIWSILSNKNTKLDNSFEKVSLNDFKLIQGLTISLQKLNPDLKELQCYDFKFCENNSHNLYILSNYGVICFSTSTITTKPKIFSLESDNSNITNIQTCPISGNYFLISTDNGDIRLHSRFYRKPLRFLSNLNQNDVEGKIDILQWSHSKPSIVFVKDSSNSISIWNLVEDDVKPVREISVKYEILDMKFSPKPKKFSRPYFMAIVTASGEVFLHSMKKEFKCDSTEEYQNEFNTFLNYLNSL